MSNSRAASAGAAGLAVDGGNPRVTSRRDGTTRGLRSKLAQGLPAVLAAWLLMAAPAGAAGAAGRDCPGPAVRFEPLGQGLWLIPASGGDATAANRGFVSHLLLAREGRRLWLLGSGPSPAFGRALDCRVRKRFGASVTDVVDPWAKAELALGNAGFPRARVWAHEAVAQAMAEQCAHCVERLRERLGDVAVDLGDAPVRLPGEMLHGDSGRLGPFDWWALPRAPGRVVTVWRHRVAAVTAAPGLLWFDGPADGRDADLAMLAASTARAAALPPPGGRWVGESGPVASDRDVAAHVAYWAETLGAARAAVEAGQIDAMAPGGAAAWPGTWAAHPRHALNWQRAWRQAEDRWLAPAAPGR